MSVSRPRSGEGEDRRGARIRARSETKKGECEFRAASDQCYAMQEDMAQRKAKSRRNKKKQKLEQKEWSNREPAEASRQPQNAASAAVLVSGRWGRSLDEQGGRTGRRLRS